MKKCFRTLTGAMEDATGLPRGVSRWTLTRLCQPARLDATALSRGGSRSQLCSLKRETPRGKPVASGIGL